MAVIYLIRHGQASFNHENYDQLSDLGMEQAKLLGDSLARQNVAPDAIYQGAMQRHHQTAHHSLGRYTSDIPVLTMSQWNEYDHREILAKYDERLATPQSTKALISSNPNPMALFQKLFVAAVGRWTSGEFDDDYKESWQDFTSRVQQAFLQVKESGHRRIVVYTSGGPISLICAQLLGLPLEQFMKINWTLVNGGITKIILNDRNGQPMLSSVNEHAIFSEIDSKKLITYT